MAGIVELPRVPVERAVGRRKGRQGFEGLHRIGESFLLAAQGGYPVEEHVEELLMHVEEQRPRITWIGSGSFDMGFRVIST